MDSNIVVRAMDWVVGGPRFNSWVGNFFVKKISGNFIDFLIEK
jgi:hypothetical protein